MNKGGKAKYGDMPYSIKTFHEQTTPIQFKNKEKEKPNIIEQTTPIQFKNKEKEKPNIIEQKNGIYFEKNNVKIVSKNIEITFVKHQDVSNYIIDPPKYNNKITSSIDDLINYDNDEQ